MQKNKKVWLINKGENVRSVETVTKEAKALDLKLSAF